MSDRNRSAARARFLPLVLAVALVLAQIAYPLTAGPARDRVTVLVVLLAAGTALAHAAVTRGFRYAAGFLVIVSGLGLLSEVVGVALGVPYGCYEYAVDRIGPGLAGVPVLVPLAWTGGVYPVWIVAGLLTARAGRLRTPARIALTAIGAVGWDLFLDPQMVADGQWTWCDSDSGLPGVPEIPLTNYLGWLVVATVMAALLAVWEHAAPAPSQPRDEPATVVVPVAVFCWTWLGSTLAHAAFLGLPASAGYGFLGMGVLGVPLLVLLVRDRRTATADRPRR
ncbi:carotenoid biosynthesis protein [Nocardia farcinica]